MKAFSQVRLVPLHSVSDEVIEELRLMRNAPEVAKFMKSRHEISKEEHQAWYRRVLSNPNISVFCIVDECAGLLGQVNATLDENRSQAILGIYVSKAKATGVGASVQSAFNAYLFDAFPINELVANVFPGNLASLKMYEKLGFEWESEISDKEGLVSLKLTRAKWRAVGSVSLKYAVAVED